MQRGGAQTFERGEVVRRAIAFVVFQAVLRKDRVPSLERGVPGDLGQNRSGGNRKTQCVAVDQRFLRKRQVDTDGVHQHAIAGCGQLLHGPAHGQARSLQNIHMVDFEGVGGSHGPGSGALPDSVSKDLAPLRRQLLAVIQAANRFLGIEDHGCGEYRTEQRTAAGFVQPRDGPEPSAPESPFMTAGRHRVVYDIRTRQRTDYSRSRRRAAFPFRPRR